MKRAAASRKTQNDSRRQRSTHGRSAGKSAPAWAPEAFARAVVRSGLKTLPRKSLLSLRIDADVLEWFRAQGRGYQSRMNALLRAYMEAHK